MEIEKPTLKFIWNPKGPHIAKKALLKKNKSVGLTLLYFKTYCKATVIKKMWYGHKDRNIDQWEIIKITEISHHVYGEMNFDKGANIIQWRKGGLFSNGVEKLHMHIPKNKVRCLPKTIYKN